MRLSTAERLTCGILRYGKVEQCIKQRIGGQFKIGIFDMVKSPDLTGRGFFYGGEYKQKTKKAYSQQIIQLMLR
jgi:hypothetical protein